MATHDYVIANGTGNAVRSDLNNALAAIVSNNSSSSEPATKYAYQWWADTTTGQLKLRNSANNGWVTIFELDGTMLMEDGTVSAPGLAFASDLNTGFFRSAADKINFATGGVERLEIGSSEVVFNDGSNDVDFRVESNGQTHMLFVDGGNDRVGIGTASPSKKLHIVPSGSNAYDAVQIGDGLYLGNTSDNNNAALFHQGGGADLEIGSQQHITFTTGNTAGSATERARIDSSGRLLVGMSSSADQNAKIQSATTAFEVFEGFQHGSNSVGAILRLAKSRGSIGSQGLVSNNDELGRISFVGSDGSNYRNSAFIKCEVDGTPGSNDMPGRLVFSTTADGASSPTERLRIDSSGRLLVGTTTEGQGSADNFTVADSGHCGISIRSGTTSEGAIYFSDGTSGTAEYRGYFIYDHDGDHLRIATGATERLRIDSSGRLGVGVSTMAGGSSSVTILRSSALRWADSDGTQRADIYGDSSSNLVFRNGTGSTERMRIDSSGNVLVGKAAASDSSGTGVQLLTGGGASVDIVTNAASNISVNHIYNINATRNGYRYYVSIDGGIRNFSGSNVNLSDEREKKNIVDMNSTWSELKQWTLRQFHFNSQDDSEDKCYGVVAQQIETVSPQVLSTFETNPTTTRKGVKEQKMMWMAIKALQEAQARIETLETEVAALKAG